MEPFQDTCLLFAKSWELLSLVTNEEGLFRPEIGNGIGIRELNMTVTAIPVSGKCRPYIAIFLSLSNICSSIFICPDPL